AENETAADRARSANLTHSRIWGAETPGVAVMKGQILRMEAIATRRRSRALGCLRTNSIGAENGIDFSGITRVRELLVCPQLYDCGLPYGTRLALLARGGRACAAPPVRARLPFTKANALAARAGVVATPA